MAYLVVRLRGTVNTPYWAEHTLRLLRLKSRFSATIVPENEVYEGMLKKVKDHVAWCKADAQTIKLLLEKRGKVIGDKSINDEVLRSLGFSSIDDLAIALANDSIKFNDLKLIKPYFRLAPPRKGFKKSSKHMYSNGGILGKNEELSEMVARMV
jgi:large subunit ribosomal protein L30